MLDMRSRPSLFWDVTQRRLPAFRHELSAPSSRAKQSKRTAWLLEPIGCPETSTANSILGLLDSLNRLVVPKRQLLTVFLDCFTPWTDRLSRNVDCLEYSWTAWLLEPIGCPETSTAYSIRGLLDYLNRWVVPKRRLLTVFLDFLIPWTNGLSRNVDCLLYSWTAWPENMVPVCCPETSTAWPLRWNRCVVLRKSVTAGKYLPKFWRIWMPSCSWWNSTSRV